MRSQSRHDGILRAQIRTKIYRLYLEAVSATSAESLFREKGMLRALMDTVSALLDADLQHFASLDPGSYGDPRLILDTYTSFACVLHYRLAHAVLCSDGDLNLRRRVARWISDRGKVISGADIHPGAAIGKRFVLDHAFGTVIGETVAIGDDCYLLGGVILGARGIAGNPSGKRHPTIGNNVQIGSFARVFGPVTVGNDVFIAPHCAVTTDVPDGSRVTLAAQLQISKSNAASGDGRLKVFGSTVSGDELLVMGEGFVRPRLQVLDENFMHCRSIATSRVWIDSVVLHATLVDSDRYEGVHENYHIKIADEGEEVILLAPPGLKGLLRQRRHNMNKRDPRPVMERSYVV